MKRITKEKIIKKCVSYHNFDNCIYNRMLKFDGVQYFKPISIFGGIKSLKSNKLRKINNISILRIPYMEYDNIEEKLKFLYDRQKI